MLAVHQCHAQRRCPPHLCWRLLWPPLPPQPATRSGACPLNDVCEYACNNGPSLHGRKRVRQPAPVLGDGMAEPLLPEGDHRRFFGGGDASGGGGKSADLLWRNRGRGGRARRSGSGSEEDEEEGMHSSSISGGSDSGASDSEAAEGSGGSKAEGLVVRTRRQAAATMPKPTLRQVPCLAGGW